MLCNNSKYLLTLGNYYQHSIYNDVSSTGIRTYRIQSKKNGR